MIEASISVDLIGSCNPATPPCGPFIEKWREWAVIRGQHEMAMLTVCDPNEYFAGLDAKRRNMLRKVKERGYRYCQFIWNDHLDEIYDINTSKPVRSGGPMLGHYMAPPHRSSSVKPCRTHHTAYIGGFDSHDHLRCYAVLAVCNQLAVINQILGHGDYLTHGIMNGLIEAINRHCYLSTVKWVNYLSLGSSPEGLRKFKQSVGFNPTHVTFV